MDLEALDRKINRLERKISLLRLLQPTNITQEKKRFFKNRNYNPQFHYFSPRINVKKIKKELVSLNPGNSSLEKLFKSKIKYLNLKLNIIKSIGKEDFTFNSIKLYKKPIPTDVSYAYKQIKNNISTFKKQRQRKVEQINKILKKYLKIYKLNWQVKIAKKTPARISCYSKIIYLRKGALFTERELRRLVAHEIDTHILRKENGKIQPFKIFASGFSNYETTEEGLALFNEFLASPRKKTKKLLPPLRILLRILAINLSLKYSFREVFEKLVALGIPQDMSFEAVLRSKRGIADTKLKGAFTKDCVYLNGWYKILSFLKMGGNLNDLYIGKIGIKNLETVKKIKGVKKPVILPIFYHPKRTDFSYVKRKNSRFRKS